MKIGFSQHVLQSGIKLNHISHILLGKCHHLTHSPSTFIYIFCLFLRQDVTNLAQAGFDPPATMPPYLVSIYFYLLLYPFSWTQMPKT
jgi:hypothetical protein